SSDLISSGIIGENPDRSRDRRYAYNPIANTYRTSDDRWVSLVMLESDRFWPDLCEHLGRPDLMFDPRFANSVSRSDNAEECVRELDAIFASATLDEWRQRFKTLAGAWSAQQTPM